MHNCVVSCGTRLAAVARTLIDEYGLSDGHCALLLLGKGKGELMLPYKCDAFGKPQS